MALASPDREGIWVTATTIDQMSTHSIPEMALAVIATMTRAG